MGFAEVEWQNTGLITACRIGLEGKVSYIITTVTALILLEYDERKIYSFCLFLVIVVIRSLCLRYENSHNTNFLCYVRSYFHLEQYYKYSYAPQLLILILSRRKVIVPIAMICHRYMRQNFH